MQKLKTSGAADMPDAKSHPKPPASRVRRQSTKSTSDDTPLDLSVTVPIYNEAANIPPLFEELTAALDKLKKTYEIIAVDDGSTDDSLQKLREESEQCPALRVIRFRRNYGQTAAMMAGIDFASGEVIVSIDADLQNDPEDIETLLTKLDEGYDVVSGWRKDRKDAPFRRNFVSRLANRLISSISGVELRDYGCTLKAYRPDVIKGVRLRDSGPTPFASAWPIEIWIGTRR
jgi:dolichol-phosphate mannosyltransferase